MLDRLPTGTRTNRKMRLGVWVTLFKMQHSVLLKKCGLRGKTDQISTVSQVKVFRISLAITGTRTDRKMRLGVWVTLLEMQDFVLLTESTKQTRFRCSRRPKCSELPWISLGPEPIAKYGLVCQTRPPSGIFCSRLPQLPPALNKRCSNSYGGGYNPWERIPHKVPRVGERTAATEGGVCPLEFECATKQVQSAKRGARSGGNWAGREEKRVEKAVGGVGLLGGERGGGD
ncbi:hypothetical protein B0H13DRAFT_1856097 [Mycena leptocephala]|nr:hypothetical protein B0H13DRAFT_1856097 [Mycena leptocephala]